MMAQAMSALHSYDVQSDLPVYIGISGIGWYIARYPSSLLVKESGVGSTPGLGSSKACHPQFNTSDRCLMTAS